MAELLKGAPVCTALRDQLSVRAQRLRDNGVIPTLAILRVGERADDIAYEKGAMKRCGQTGVKVDRFLLEQDCTQTELLSTIRTINEDDMIHGCLMLRPLPDKDGEAAACSLLDPRKDVDGMTSMALSSVFQGKGPGYPPCTAQACMELLDYYHVPLEGKRVVVLGRSLVIGKPVSMMLQARNATVTMCHSRTANLPAVCREADVLVVAIGKANLVRKEYVRSGQIVIDVGINSGAGGNLCGDVDPEVGDTVEALTPVPGGVGTLTTAVLAKHVIEAAEKSVQ